MIIDFHTHTFPDKIAKHAIEHMQSLSHNAVFSDGTVSGLKASMASAGVTHSVVLPVATNPAKVEHINNISIDSTERENLIYFGCMHPDYEGYRTELARLAENGIKGIKIHPLYQGVDINDIRYLRILDRAAEVGLIVVMHSGADPAYWNEVRCNPQMTRNALDQVGPVTLVMAHMGGLMNWDKVPEFLADTKVYIDTAFSLGKMSQTEENFYTEEQLQLLTSEQFCQLIRTFGSKRVLFGTDSPWASQKTALEDFSALPLTDEEKENILYKNACTLLNITT